MHRKILFEMNSVYRDNFRVAGYKFGHGEKSVCIMGAMRGNEVQQLYICSQLVNKLQEIEKSGGIKEGKSIMVIPCANSYSMNVGKRFWPSDNTDINRMYPGYSLGETTQRIAAGIFESVCDYKIGLQFASNYISGNFLPHVKIMKTDFVDIDMAKDFDFPYVVVRDPKPYDTTTLNYNWQIWETKAFSLYTSSTNQIDMENAILAEKAVLGFLAKQNIIEYNHKDVYSTKVISEKELVNVKSDVSGIFIPEKGHDDVVSKGDVLANVINPYEGNVIKQIIAPCDGTIFFMQDRTLLLANSLVYRIIKED